MLSAPRRQVTETGSARATGAAALETERELETLRLDPAATHSGTIPVTRPYQGGCHSEPPRCGVPQDAP